MLRRLKRLIPYPYSHLVVSSLIGLIAGWFLPLGWLAGGVFYAVREWYSARNRPGFDWPGLWWGVAGILPPGLFYLTLWSSPFWIINLGVH